MENKTNMAIILKLGGKSFSITVERQKGLQLESDVLPALQSLLINAGYTNAEILDAVNSYISEDASAPKQKPLYS